MKKYKVFFSKFYLFLALLLLSALPCTTSTTILVSKEHITKASALESEKITYAKAGKDCVLYKDQTLSDSINNILFYVPESYFVSIISKISNDAYKVLYGNFTGYCKAEDLTIANFTPSNCLLSGIKFDISQDAGTQIWSLPSDQNGRVLSTISADTKQIEYIASTIGEIPIGGSSNLWYYARFTPASNTTAVYEGYIYSESTTNLTHIPKNLETNNEVIATPAGNNPVTLNTGLKVVFIILICLPFVVLFVISLVKARKQFKSHIAKPEPTYDAPEPVKKISGSFVKKKTKPKPKPIREESEDTIEIVFPEYNFVDDDDLL